MYLTVILLWFSSLFIFIFHANNNNINLFMFTQFVIISIFTKIIKTGMFPEYMKQAQICFLHKKLIEVNLIIIDRFFLLAYFSKVMDKVIHMQLHDYLDQNMLLTKRQYGFRKNDLVQWCKIFQYKCWITWKNIKHFLDLSKLSTPNTFAYV